MPSVDLVATEARVSHGQYWNLLNNCLTDDSTYTVRSSGGVVGDGYLVLDHFSAGLPQDITIEGIEVRFKAKTETTPGTDSTVSVFLSVNGVMGNQLYVSGTKTTSALSTTETLFILGSPTDPWFTSIRRPQIHGNPLFSVFLGASGDLTVDHWIQYVYIRVHYSLNTFLRGERSAFPPPLELWPYTGPTDSIPRKYNGTGTHNQINAEDINLLGDCIYKIQNTVLSFDDIIRAEGGEGTALSPQSLMAFTLTLSGNWAGNEDSVYFHNTQRIHGSTKTVLSNQTTTNLTDVRWTKPPIIPFNLYTGVFMPMVQGCAWLNDGGNILPMHITISSFSMRHTQEYLPSPTPVMSTSIGFRLAVLNATSAVTQSTDDWAGHHRGYSYQQWSSQSNPCTVIVKLTGFGAVGA